MASRDDDDTPVLRPRSLSSAVANWNIVWTWLESNRARRSGQRVTSEGSVVEICDETGRVTIGVVRPGEDPSTTLVRCIGALARSPHPDGE